jgi:hypothetical protein
MNFFFNDNIFILVSSITLHYLHVQKKYRNKGKCKVVPVLKKTPRHEDVLGEWRYSSTHPQHRH